MDYLDHSYFDTPRLEYFDEATFNQALSSKVESILEENIFGRNLTVSEFEKKFGKFLQDSFALKKWSFNNELEFFITSEEEGITREKYFNKHGVSIVFECFSLTELKEKISFMGYLLQYIENGDLHFAYMTDNDLNITSLVLVMLPENFSDILKDVLGKHGKKEVPKDLLPLF